MTPHAAWRMLDIEPTADRRAVKRAYAARLKAIDPDRDIQIFLKLRDALEVAEAAATRLAARAARAAERNDPDEGESGADDGVRFDWRGGDGFGDPSGIAVRVGAIDSGMSFAEPPLASRPEVPVEPAPLELPASAGPDPRPVEIVDPEPAEVDPRDLVAKALFGRHDDHDRPHLVEAVEALLADDRMERLDFAAETEEWLAYVLAQAGEAADPVIPLVARHFNWAAELGAALQRPTIARVATRADDLHCADMLRDPSHRWHEAFALLGQPAPRRIDFYNKVRFGKQVAELIESLRYHHPDVERLLDADHLALWTAAVPPPDHRPAPLGIGGISWYGWLIMLWLAVLVARLIIWTVS
jgi:hypothetical protein